MKKNKKKLPKYWIGKRPIDPGYQINKEIGNATFNTQLGQDLSGEARAARLNIIPQTLGKLGQNILYPTEVLRNVNVIPVGGTVTGVSAINKAGGFSNLISKGATPFVSGIDPVSGLPTEIGVKAGDKAITSGTLNTIGTVAGALGTLYGGYNVYNDIANSGPGLSQSDIANSSAVNTYTTAYGNTYTQHGGVDRGSVLDYANSERKSKQLGLTMDTIGLGSSLGGLVGGTALAGSVGGPLGTAIGAGLGLLAGGVASLLGFGDNEEEYKEMMRRQEDVFAMQDRLSESIAKDKDTKAEFYGRAANGKRPVWTPAGLVGRAATARVSNGEVVGNFEDGVVTRIPGLKNNKDTKLAALKDGDFVITNKYGLSDYAAATGDYAGALDLLETIMGMRNSKGYKCGKLPKHANGMWDSIFSAIPHLASFVGNLSLYNRAKEADTYAPDVYVDNPEGTKAVNTLAQLRFDADPYYREALRGLNWANYNARRNVGLGLGGRAIAQATNYTNYLRGLGDITKMYNEALNSYAEKYANALANLGATNQGRRMEAAAKRHAWLQQAQGQKESWMAQYRKNIDQNLLNAAADYMRLGQWNASKEIQEKTLGLYLQLVYLDRDKYNNLLKNQNGKLPCHEDGLVDTRSDTTYKGYNPNPIPWGAGLGPAGQGPLALLDGIEAASLVSNNPYLLTGIAPSPGKVTYTPEQMTKQWLKHGQEYARKNKLSTFMGPNGKMYAHMPDGKVRSFEAIGKEIRGEKPITYTAKKFKPVDHTIKKVPKVISTSKKTYNYGAITANDFK